MLDKQKISQELENIDTTQWLKDFHSKYLWKKSPINEEFKELWKLSPEEKKQKWQFLSELKEYIQKKFYQKQDQIKKQEIDKKLQKDIIDITTPGIKANKWYLNLISKTRRQIEEISRWMWFVIETWKDLVSMYENFNSLNIPNTHPSTEMHDTIYANHEDKDWNKYLLRTHTSAVQNYILQKYSAPVKAVIPGKTYRYENMDACHDTVFWQYEWVVVDENICIAELKYTLRKLLSKLLENENIQIRMRPAYFPFVEPWIEVDASCPICNNKWCWLCKNTWWLEIVWAWMIHKNVLKEWWIDRTKYSWFAFGMWLSRLIAIKYWIKDIRLLTSWDIKFIQSF